MAEFGLQLADVIIKGIGLLGAGAFFAYKVVAGFNNQNLSLSLDCMRSPSVEGVDARDVVVARIGIEKGTTAALTLEGLEARFKWGEVENEAVHVPVEIHRLIVQQSLNPGQVQTLWKPQPDRPHLYLSPGEKTAFSCAAKVPRDSMCQVDVVAFGRRKRSTFQAQWRASTIVPALPRRDRDAPAC